MENHSFEYTYSAQQQQEVEAIRQKYLPKEEDKMEQLRRLHAIPTQKAQFHRNCAFPLSSSHPPPSCMMNPHNPQGGPFRLWCPKFTFLALARQISTTAQSFFLAASAPGGARKRSPNPRKIIIPPHSGGIIIIPFRLKYCDTPRRSTRIRGTRQYSP